MIKFKNEKDKTLFCALHPVLIMIFADAYVYMKEKYQVDLIITQTISTIEEDKRLSRKSPSHREGRAIDIRTKNLTIEQIKDLVDYINNNWRYKKYRYMSKSGVERLAYYHDSGHGSHLHLAIHSKFAQTVK